MQKNNITDTEINEITKLSKTREKAFFTIIRQSGLKPSTVRQLKIKHLEEFRESDTSIPCKIDIPNEIEKNKFGRHPSFIGEESINYLRNYLTDRELNGKEKLTLESLLFAMHEKPSKQISVKEINRTFKKTAKKVRKGKLNELQLNDLREFFKQKSEEIGHNHVNYLMGNTPDNYTPEDDETYRRLYKEIVMDSLEIEQSSKWKSALHIRDKETHQLKERLEQIENTVFPKYRLITDPEAEWKKIEDWIEKNPEEAKIERERYRFWERQREEEFKKYQKLMRENPDALITYLQNLKEKVEVLKVILQTTTMQNTPFNTKKPRVLMEH